MNQGWEKNCYEKEKYHQTKLVIFKYSNFYQITSFFYENISFTFSKNDLSELSGFG